MKVRLLLNGSALLTEAVLQGVASVDTDAANIELNGHGAELDYDEASRLLAACDGDRARAREDAELAIRIHECLPATRRQARVPEFWHYITLIASPTYVPWRSAAGSPQWTDLTNRFLGGFRRNAVGRLWWWAEMTRRLNEEGLSNYGLTRSAAHARLMLWVVDDHVADCHLVMNRLLELLVSHGLSDHLVDGVFKSLKAVAGARVIDMLSPNEARTLADQIFEQALAAAAKRPRSR